MAALKSLPVHSFNAFVIQILRQCLQSHFQLPFLLLGISKLLWVCCVTVLKVPSRIFILLLFQSLGIVCNHFSAFTLHIDRETIF